MKANVIHPLVENVREVAIAVIYEVEYYQNFFNM